MAWPQEAPAEDDDSSAPVVSTEDDRTDAEAVPFRPCRILDRSTSISQREDSLAHALIVTVLNGSSDSILEAIAARFEIEVPFMSLRRFGDARFLLILPTSELVERVYNGERIFISTSLRLHVVRWTRFLNSTTATLPCLIAAKITVGLAVLIQIPLITATCSKWWLGAPRLKASRRRWTLRSWSRQRLRVARDLSSVRWSIQ